MALTEKQQQIKSMVEQGKKAPEIAKELGISDNAVYQHLRNIRNGGGSGNSGRQSAKKKPAAKKRAAKAKAAPKAAPTPTPAPTTSNPAAVRTLTPLQAIRARRDDILSGVKDAQAEVAAAQKALDAAADKAAKAEAKHKDELKSLAQAETALTGRKVGLDGKPVETPAPKESAAPKEAAKKPAASKPAAAKKQAAKPSPGGNGSQAAQAAPSAPSGDAQPTTQAEREAQADHDGTKAEADAAQAASEAPQTA